MIFSTSSVVAWVREAWGKLTVPEAALHVRVRTEPTLWTDRGTLVQMEVGEQQEDGEALPGALHALLQDLGDPSRKPLPGEVKVRLDLLDGSGRSIANDRQAVPTRRHNISQVFDLVVEAEVEAPTPAAPSPPSAPPPPSSRPPVTPPTTGGPRALAAYEDGPIGHLALASRFAYDLDPTAEGKVPVNSLVGLLFAGNIRDAQALSEERAMWQQQITLLKQDHDLERRAFAVERAGFATERAAWQAQIQQIYAGVAEERRAHSVQMNQLLSQITASGEVLRKHASGRDELLKTSLEGWHLALDKVGDARVEAATAKGEAELVAATAAGELATKEAEASGGQKPDRMVSLIKEVTGAITAATALYKVREGKKEARREARKETPPKEASPNEAPPKEAPPKEAPVVEAQEEEDEEEVNPIVGLVGGVLDGTIHPDEGATIFLAGCSTASRPNLIALARAIVKQAEAA